MLSVLRRESFPISTDAVRTDVVEGQVPVDYFELPEQTNIEKISILVV